MKDLLKTHKYLIIIIVSLVILVLIIITGMTLRKPTEILPPEGTPISIIPTAVDVDEFTTIHPDDPTFPLLSPQPFTGATEPTVSQKEIASIEQEWNLRENPYFDQNFTVEYDYSQDVFVVTLFPPQGNNLEKFNQWRLANYSGILEDRFQLK